MMETKEADFLWEYLDWDGNPILESALAYAKIGWPVFPLHTPTPYSCSCSSGANCPTNRRGKHPRTLNGFKDATTDPETIRDWWGNWPKANIGIATGKVSEIFVVDVDPRNRGDVTLLELEQTHGELSQEHTVSTGGGGLHFYFAYPAVNSKIGKELGQGIDIKSDGGYVVAPPSLHQSGKQYSWLHPDYTDSALTPIPQWMVELIEDKSRAPKPGMRGDTRFVEGNRNNSLFSEAGKLRNRGLEESEILPLLHQLNGSLCSPPIDEKEVAQIASNIGRYAPGDNEDNLTNREHLTDVGNSNRLIQQHGKGLKFCSAWGKWLVWDGAKWVIDKGGVVFERAKDTANAMYEEAGTIASSSANPSDTIARKTQITLATEMLIWAKESESKWKIEAMVKLAESKSEIQILPEDLDSNQWALNCLNGIVDLRTGKLLPHSPEYLLTKQIPIRFDSNAEAPEFLSFLNRIMGGNQELITFLQKSFGYALTGDVSEQVIFFLYGKGANGKSTLLNAMLGMTGNYSMKAPADILMSKKHASHPTEMADLAGMRLVAAHESEQGKKLNEALVKELTGGDPIRARRMREDHWEFNPTHKIFFATNHKPVISGTENGIWRRIKLIPFQVTISDEEQDTHLPEKLKEEWPGILRWAIEGCLKWQEEGLKAPLAVKEATQEYRIEMDTLAGFVEECCVMGSECEVKSKDLYATYTNWSKANGEKELSQNKLTSRLLENVDITKTHNRKWRGLLGIGLVCDAPDF